MFTAVNGDVYSGQWRHGLRHGTGVFTNHRGGSYSGAFADDLPTGRYPVDLFDPDFSASDYSQSDSELESESEALPPGREV